MTDKPQGTAGETTGGSASGPITWEAEFTRMAADFSDPHQEWRRLFFELFGTFLLVLVAAGGGMMGAAFPNTISRTAAVDGHLGLRRRPNLGAVIAVGCAFVLRGLGGGRSGSGPAQGTLLTEVTKPESA